MLMTQIYEECLKQIPVYGHDSVSQYNTPSSASVRPSVSTSPTPKQLAYYHALVKGKELTAALQEIVNQPCLLTRSLVSTRITGLMALPWKAYRREGMN